MGKMINCYVDDATLIRLEAYALEHGRSVVDLAESAIADAASKITTRHQPAAQSEERET